MNDRRYKLSIRDMTDAKFHDLKPIELAVLWFMRAHEAEHKRGTTLEDACNFTGREETAILRAWRGLERAGLIRLEARLTDEGRAIRNAS